VRTLFDRDVGAGSYKVTVDVSPSPRGVYIYPLKAGGNAAARRLVVAP